MSAVIASTLEQAQSDPEHHWKTREGVWVHIEDMTDTHLTNTIAYIERLAPSLAWLEIDPWYRNMVAEWEHRDAMNDIPREGSDRYGSLS